MRPIALALFFVTSTVSAQVHVATLSHCPKMTVVESAAAPADFAPHAAKTFNIVVRKWEFVITPSPFVVNRNDSVTLQFDVKDDGDGQGHGFVLQQYAENPRTLRGGTKPTIQFVANTLGEFIFFCSVSCGEGHTNMLGTFTVVEPAPAPTITSVLPNRGSTKGHTNVIINGTNFQSGATVRFGNVDALDVDITSANNLIAETPPQAAGVVNVVVTNPDGQSATRTSAYTYIEPEPQVLSVSPDNGPTAGGTNITVHGVDFKSGATVKIGSRSALNVVFLSATTLSAVTPIGPADVMSTKSEDVTVTNPDARSGTNDNAFTWTRGNAALTSVSPASSVTTGGTIVTITGRGFTTALPMTVHFGGVAATILGIDATTVIAMAPPHAAGTVDVAVSVGNEPSTLLTGAFTYFPPGPKRRSAKK